MKDPFKRILELVRKTGDTMIVTDPNGQDVYVVMDVDRYESLLEEIHVCDEDDETCEDYTEADVEKDAVPADQWEIPGEFIIDDPEGGLADEPGFVEPVVGRKTPEVPPVDAPAKNIWSTMKPANEPGQTWDLSQMNAQQLADLEHQYKEFAEKNVRSAIQDVSVNSQETKTKSVESGFSEEQFYLEPIE